MCGERRGETIDKCDRCIGLFRTGVSVPSSLPATSVRLATATSAVKNKDLIALLLYMDFVSSELAKKNIIMLPKKTKKKKITKRKPSRRYVLLPPRMLNLPKAYHQPTMIY